MEDRSYKHARVTIGGGARVQQQDAATNQLWNTHFMDFDFVRFILLAFGLRAKVGEEQEGKRDIFVHRSIDIGV